MSRAAPAVVVIGAGSIGRRHARNLAVLGAKVDVMDPQADRADDVEGATATPFDLDALGAYEGVVIASPTIFHREQVEHTARLGVPMLVEKPLAMSKTDADALTGHEVMVGYNLRFHEPIRVLRRLTAEGRAGTIRGARFWFGSFLPDWRPDADYRTGYSARADLGGGVLLDAIHELDLAVWWFGPDLYVRGAVVARTGPLDIDVEDTVKALLVAPEGVVIDVSLDYLSRTYRRGIELIGDDATLRLDWHRQTIEIERGNDIDLIAADVPVAQSYERQAERFLDWIRGVGTPEVDAREGAASVRLADDIRAAGQ